MEYRQDGNTRLVLDKEHFVREAASQGKTDGTMHARVLLWVSHDCAEDGIYAEQELGAKALDAFFVLIKRIR